MTKSKSALAVVAIVLAMMSGCSDDGAVPDTENPTIDVFAVNRGIPYTVSRDVTVNIFAGDNSGLDGMEVRVSEDPDWTGVDWQAYSTGTPLTLTTGDGPKTVYGQARDASGNVSQTASAEITLAEESTVVCFDPFPLTISDSGFRTVVLKFVNAQHVSSAKLKFRFDPVFLHVQVLTLEILPSHILESTGASLVVSDEEYDNSTGSVVVGALAQHDDGFSGVTGDGPFAVIVFEARTAIDTPTSLTIEEYSVYTHSTSGPPELADNVFVFDGVFQPDE